MSFATTWIDLEGIMLSEIRERKILHVIIYMWKIKNKLVNIIKKNQQKFKQTLTKIDIRMLNKHTKRCSTLFVIREMQVKTTMKFLLEWLK